MKQIHFIIPYPLQSAPSQRFRFEFFLEKMRQQYSIRILPFYTSREYQKIKQGNSLLFLLAVTRGLFRRVVHIFRSGNADYIFIHREATPAGLPWVEFILARILKKKIIYDFDDAIWLPDPHESGWRERLKWKSKIRSICNWSYRISCGNHYLARYASEYCPDVRILPTVIDPVIHCPADNRPNNPVPVIGWTGSSTTLVYLESLFPLLEELHKTHTFQLLVISDRKPARALPFLEFIPWSMHQETAALQRMDLGIMPLPDDEWARGKCGFKLIQYGAVGLPSVASNVGVNPKIILNGESGFLCENEEEWIQNLRKLLEDKALRKSMGERARKHIEKNYSVNAVREEFLKLFE